MAEIILIKNKNDKEQIKKYRIWIGPVEQLVHIVLLGDADGPQAVLVIHGDDALCHHGIHHRDVHPVGAHLAGDGHQRRTVRIGVREVHHKKARSSNAWCFFFLTCAAGCFIIRMISDVCGAVRPAVKLRQAKKGTAMREEKASALPLLLDVRRMDENNRAYAYRMLRKNIMTLQLQPGCQLSEAELCEQLAMSRTPVHEALMMLKSEWLVDVLPQRGSIVSKISVPYLNEGFAMRRILEPALLRGLAGKLTREQLNEFQELLNRQNEDLYLDQDAADDFFISLDNDFHRLLYHDSGYDRIWEAMHNVTSHMDRVRYLDSALCRGNIASVQKEHEQIFGYLRDGLPLDVDVEALFEHHLGMYRENFQKILERFPDFFVQT